MAIIPTVMFGDKKEQLLMSTLLSKGVNLSWLWCFLWLLEAQETLHRSMREWIELYSIYQKIPVSQEIDAENMMAFATG